MWGLDLATDSEILTTEGEHLGALGSLSTINKLKNVKINFFPVRENTDHFNVQRFTQMITPKTKLIVLSHVFWETGNINPVKEICKIAKSLNVPVLVDGAQAVGAVPVEVEEVGADFYVFPAHKWLLGPEGIGFLYISSKNLSKINQTYAGNASFRYHDGRTTYIPSSGAKRFEIGTRYRPIINGMISGLDWLNEIGTEQCHSQINSNMSFLKQRIEETSNLSLLSSNIKNIATVKLAEDVNAKSVRKELEKYNVYVNDIERFNAIRISIGFYNTEEQIINLLSKINHCIKKH